MKKIVEFKRAKESDICEIGGCDEQSACDIVTFLEADGYYPGFISGKKSLYLQKAWEDPCDSSAYERVNFEKAKEYAIDSAKCNMIYYGNRLNEKGISQASIAGLRRHEKTASEAYRRLTAV